MLQLRRINISGFKAVDRFQMDVGPGLTLLVGMNGSGKSSILQAFAFARFLIEGRPQSFFDDRFWTRQDFKFRSVPRGKGTVIDLGLRFAETRWGAIRWDVQWGLNLGRLFSEKIRVRASEESEIETIYEFTAKDGGAFGNEKVPGLSVVGSLLEGVAGFEASERDAEILRSVIEWAEGIRSLELLSPAAMKGGTRLSPGDMGMKGDRLAGFLAALSAEQKSKVVQRLSQFYPLENFDTVRKRAGWIDLRVSERFTNFGDVRSIHMSDGFMRLLALCAIPEMGDGVSLILLDEIEDGIEPHILSRVIDLIRTESKAQILATSHSPLLANSISVDNIRFISRNSDGRTFAADASEMPTFSEGSEYLGPGELWANTEMNVLHQEALRESSKDDGLLEGGGNL
ncbi:MAG: AAA family ATPase [Sphingomonas sp.]